MCSDQVGRRQSLIPQASEHLAPVWPVERRRLRRAARKRDMGHEFMGEVVEVGRDSKDALKVGDRVVIPFTIICGECVQCRRSYFSACERTNRNKNVADKMFGHTTAGLFGYTHLTGGYQGGLPMFSSDPTFWTTVVAILGTTISPSSPFSIPGMQPS